MCHNISIFQNLVKQTLACPGSNVANCSVLKPPLLHLYETHQPSSSSTASLHDFEGCGGRMKLQQLKYCVLNQCYENRPWQVSFAVLTLQLSHLINSEVYIKSWV